MSLFRTAQDDQQSEDSTEQVVIRALADLRALCCDDWGRDFTKLVMESRRLYMSERPKKAED